jgi:hypothetical protein
MRNLLRGRIGSDHERICYGCFSVPLCIVQRCLEARGRTLFSLRSMKAVFTMGILGPSANSALWTAVMHRHTRGLKTSKPYHQIADLLYFPIRMLCVWIRHGVVPETAVECCFRAYGSYHRPYLTPTTVFQINGPKCGSY